MEITGYKDKHEYINKNGITSVVYLMDCMELLKQIPEKYFELAVVDPPYGIGANKMTLGNGRKKINRGQSNWDNNIPSEEYFTLLKNSATNQIIWGGNYMTEHLSPSRCWILWDKGTGDNDYADGELAWTSFDRVLKIFRKSWVGANAKNDTDRIHPTEKPVVLYEWLVKNYAKDGDKILDTHLGSQSSRIAAANMGFNFIGCELDKDYFDEGNKRFENAMKQQSLFTYKEQTAEQLNLL